MSPEYALIVGNFNVGLNFGLKIGYEIAQTSSIVFALFFGLFRLLIGQDDFKLPSVEISEHFELKYSNFFHKSTLVKVLIYVMSCGMLFMLFVNLDNNIHFESAEGLFLGITFGFISGISYLIARGIRKSLYVAKDTLQPNQGINKTIKYTFWISILAISIFILSFFFSKEFLSLSIFGVPVYLILNILWPSLFFVAGSFGFRGILYHQLIRHFLVKEKLIPKKFIDFLNTACRLGYLKRVGGGYRFFHREFQDYLFAKYGEQFATKYKSNE